MNSRIESNEKGTATIEMAIMMPVFVLLMIAMVYFGGRQVMNTRALNSVNFFSQSSKIESKDDLPDGFLNLPHGVMGYLKKEVNVVDDSIPSNIDADYLKEVMVEDMFKIRGRYKLKNNTLVYTTSVTITDVGKIVQKFGLIDTTDDIAAELDKGLLRTETSITVNIEVPFSLEDSDVEGVAFESGGLINRQKSTLFGISHSHSHVIPKEEHISHGSYSDSATSVLLSTEKLPSPSLDWKNYWKSNVE